MFYLFNFTSQSIATQCVTCHDSYIVTPCAKCYFNPRTRHWIRAKWIFHRIWISNEYSLVTWSTSVWVTSSINCCFHCQSTYPCFMCNISLKNHMVYICKYFLQWSSDGYDIRAVIYVLSIYVICSFGFWLYDCDDTLYKEIKGSAQLCTSSGCYCNK